MTTEDKERVKQAMRVLEEAQSGQSPKSKNTLIKEALKALRAIN